METKRFVLFTILLSAFALGAFLFSFQLAPKLFVPPVAAVPPEVDAGVEPIEAGVDAGTGPDAGNDLAAQVKDLDSQPHIGHMVVVVKLEGAVSTESATKIVDTLDTLQGGAVEAIVFEIISDGGDVAAGYDIIRAIEESRVPIYCVADERAFSMAFYVFEACQHRVLTRRTSIMIHEQHFSIAADEVVDNVWLQQKVGNHRALANGLAEIVLKNLRHMSRKEYLQRVGTIDWYLNWQEAQKLGLIDYVVDTPTEAIRALQKNMRLPR
jgi:ATP-dependent protease ClpP protease subunit